MPTSRIILNPGPGQQPATADVTVIGGGPAGTAAIWALHRFAPELSTVLIEQSERLGAGSSLASLECYRTCWPALCLAKQMQRSIEVFHHADDYLGEGAAQALALRERGYLFCAMDAGHAATLHADVERLHAIGLTQIEYLDAAEVAYRFPWLGERVIAAKFDPVAGWLDSNALIHCFARSAANARVLLGVPHVSICVEGGRVTGVQTPAGNIAARAVVIAAGARSNAVAQTAGVSLPLVVRPRQSFTTGWRHEAIPDDAPMLIGGPPFPHLRPEARSGAIFGWEYRWRAKAGLASGGNEAADALAEPVYPVEPLRDPRFPPVTLALLARQFGHRDGAGFADGRYLRGVHHNVGYYVSRDGSAAWQTDASGERRPYESERAIIDAHPDVEGLFVSVAHVGHGIMSAPAAGEILACRVLGLPLPAPAFNDFGFSAAWAEYDAAVL